jgi:hypothetical protein
VATSIPAGFPVEHDEFSRQPPQFFHKVDEWEGRMGRMILAILTGYVLIGVLLTITDRILASVVPGFGAMANPTQSYLLVSLGRDLVFSIVGGYVCSWIARERAWEATWCLIALGETIGLASQVFLWRSVPHWFGIGVLVLYPLAIWIGSRLRPEVKAATEI